MYDVSSVINVDASRLNELINTPTYTKLDQITHEYVNKLDCTIWHKVAILFDLTNRVVQTILNDAETGRKDAHACDLLVKQFKQLAAFYIHDKYCDWIYDHGGWVNNRLSYF